MALGPALEVAGEDGLTDERHDFLQPTRRAPRWESSPRLLTHTHPHSLAMTAPPGHGLPVHCACDHPACLCTKRCFYPHLTDEGPEVQRGWEPRPGSHSSGPGTALTPTLALSAPSAWGVGAGLLRLGWAACGNLSTQRAMGRDRRRTASLRVMELPRIPSRGCTLETPWGVALPSVACSEGSPGGTC